MQTCFKKLTSLCFLHNLGIECVWRDDRMAQFEHTLGSNCFSKRLSRCTQARSKGTVRARPCGWASDRFSPIALISVCSKLAFVSSLGLDGWLEINLMEADDPKTHWG